MNYYLGEVWIVVPRTFWRRQYSKKIRTVLIKADDKQTAYNKLGGYTDQVRRNELWLADANPLKLKWNVLDTL